MSYGTTPLSTTAIGTNEFPASAVYVQGTSGGNFTALQGGPVSSADGNGNESAPVSVYTYDGNNATVGATSDLSSANTLIGLTKAIKANTASVVIASLPAVSVSNFPATQPVSGTVSVNSLPAGNNTIGAVTQASSPWTVQLQAEATGGATPFHLVSSAGTNATNVKNTAGMLYGYAISNTNAAARYVHFYNLATFPVVGTATPSATIQVPGNGVVIRAFPAGAAYGTGISFGTSTGASDSDSGSIGAGDLIIDLEYK